MSWNWLTDPVTSFLIGLALLIATYLARPRVRVVWTVTHGFIHNLKGKDFVQRQTPEQSVANPSPKDMSIWAQTLMVMNRGRAEADNVEIVLENKPLGLTIWPHRQYSESFNPDGRYVLAFDSLASQETISIQMIDVVKLPLVSNVRSKTTLGRYVNSYPQIQFPRWMLTIVWILVCIGALYMAWLFTFATITALRLFGYL